MGATSGIGRSCAEMFEGGRDEPDSDHRARFRQGQVRVHAIGPARVGTDRIKKMLADRPEAKVAIAAQQSGLIEPEDIAYAAVVLASDESRMITGHILPVDAGSFSD
jgi:NAD(P)-dependent dehydrogenase (short-subunit alcohol dehydrogenase family)